DVWQIFRVTASPASSVYPDSDRDDPDSARSGDDRFAENRHHRPLLRGRGAPSAELLDVRVPYFPGDSQARAADAVAAAIALAQQARRHVPPLRSALSRHPAVADRQ